MDGDDLRDAAHGLREIFRSSLCEQSADRAVAAADAVFDAVSGLSGEDAELAVRSVYERVTAAPPYTRPSSGRRLEARAVLMARDVAAGRGPRDRYIYWDADEPESAYERLLLAYASWMHAQGKSEATVRTRLQRARVLLGWLEGRGVTDISGLDARTLAEFVASLEGRYSAAGKSNLLYALRNLFSCPDVSSAMSFDPSGLLGGLHTPRHQALPPVYTQEEVSAVLGAIDRETDAGRTLYLVVALAATYGLRAGDIVRLTLDDLDLARGTIRIFQHKTGGFLELPLVEGVRLPLADYLMRTRRDCGHREVLIRTQGPAKPYAPTNRFHEPLRRAMEAAGVEPRGRRTGLHALRHSLATRMHASGVPVTDIAEVLGHSSVQSTRTYVWSDVERLRLAALEVA